MKYIYVLQINSQAIAAFDNVDKAIAWKKQNPRDYQVGIIEYYD